MNGMGVVNGYGLNAAQNRLDMLEQQRRNMGYDYPDMVMGMNGMNNNQNVNMGGMGMQRNVNNQVQMQMYKGRPVSNFYEANASLIDMDGSLHIFTDNANDRIYTKRINLDGMSEVKTYELVDNPIEELKQNQGNVNLLSQESISRNEFETYMKAIGERFDTIVSQLGNMSNIMGGMLNARNATNGEYVQPVSANDATVPTGTEPTSNDSANFGTKPVIPKGTADGKWKDGTGVESDS